MPPLQQLLLLGCLCLVGIGHPLLSQTIPSIQAPQASYRYSNMDITNEKYASVLTITARLPVSELEKQLNKQLTGLLYEDKSYDDDGQDNLKAKVWKLDDIRVEARDNHFLFEVPLKVWVSTGYKFSPLGVTLSGYKDTSFSLRVRLISEVTFSADWQLITNTRVDSYDWLTDPSISVAGFAIPIKSIVSRHLNRNSHKITKAIDKEVAESFDIRSSVRNVWEMAHQPVHLSEEYRTWLLNTPQQVMATLPYADGNNVTISVGIRGYTQTIVSSHSPVRSVAVKLPPLKIVDKLPHSFQIGLISAISYEEAAVMASAYFKGRNFSFSNGKYNLQINSIDLFGQDEQLVIKAGLTGSLRGYLYLKGIPHYDPGTKLVTLRDVEYDLDTRNVLVKAANWLLHARFTRMMKEALVFPVGEQLDALTTTIRQTLINHPVSDGIFLHGKLNEATPDKVYLTPTHIYTVVNATGEVNLDIRNLNY